jgi:hypothetical protein
MDCLSRPEYIYMLDMNQLTLGSPQHGKEHAGPKIIQHTNSNTGTRSRLGYDCVSVSVCDCSMF